MSNEATATDSSDSAAPTDGSRRWRSLWRLHFYSGMFAIPFIVLMSITGLVVLYTQPLQSLTAGHKFDVKRAGATLAYEQQGKAAQERLPKANLTAVITPRNATTATIFEADDGTETGQRIFVNPYSGKVLGTEKPSSGIVGLAHRLHADLNASKIRVSLPTVSALWDHGAVLRPYVVGDMILEVLGVWTVVLVMSGLYLWWPRRRSASTATPAKDRARTKRTGRAKWRNLHGWSGVLLLSVMLLTIVSGLAWSSYWGRNFTSLANEISPNVWTDTPPSVLGTRGQLDAVGNEIPWNTADRAIPASYATPVEAGRYPAAFALNAVAARAVAAGMKPGFKIIFPRNVADVSTKAVTYGSYTVTNSWPRKTGEARDLFLDQFSGKPLGEQTAYGYGAISYGLDTMVSTHMGTQLGIVSRIAMTALCLLSLWSSASALIMYSKRRRPGTLGLPRRPVDVRLSRRISLTAAAMAVVFPLWGVCAAVVLGLDRFFIRRNTRLRAAFGQR